MYGRNKALAVEPDTELDEKIDELRDDLRREATPEDWRAIAKVDPDLAEDLHYKAIEPAVEKFFELDESTIVRLLGELSDDFRTNIGLISDLMGLREGAPEGD